MSTTTKTRRASAATLHAVADKLGIDPERVGVLAREAGVHKKADVEHACVEWMSQQQPPAETPADAPKKERKPGLTLSQRRALLRLLDEGTIVPASAFKAMPFNHLVEVGYASSDEGGFVLTDEGQARAESINPGYRVWSAGESVAGDKSRPVAGTHRRRKVQPSGATVAMQSAARG